MKRCILACLLFCLLAASALADRAWQMRFDGSSASHAQHLSYHMGEDTCRVSANYLKVRRRAGSDSLVGHVEQADLVRVEDISGNWVKIRVLYSAPTSLDSYYGLTGWVHADYLECPCDYVSYNGNPAHGTTGVITAGGYNLRETGSKSARSLATLKRGESVEVHGYSQDGTYVRVVRAGGQNGFVAVEAVSIGSGRAPSIAPTAAPANNPMDWQVAYRNYIRLNADAWQMANESEATFTLIYVNGDAIPELVMNAGYEAAGCLILTYDGQKVDALQTARLGFRFIQGGNVLNNSDGNMGYYYDNVYTIQNGRWVTLGEGSYESQDATWDSYGRCLDESAAYTWNGVRVARAGYYAGLAQIFDVTRAYAAAGYTKNLAALLGN